MVTLFLRRAASRRAALSLSLCRRWSEPKKSVEKLKKVNEGAMGPSLDLALLSLIIWSGKGLARTRPAPFVALELLKTGPAWSLFGPLLSLTK